MKLLKLLHRKTSTGYFVPELDGLRFFAILPVILFHFAGIFHKHAPTAALRATEEGFFGDMLGRGDFGVRLFFTISGYILGKLFIRNIEKHSKLVDIRSYILRRITRLEPTYVINLVLVFLLLIIIRHANAKQLLPHLFASMFYVHSIYYGRMSDVNYVTWSLEVEIQFYILAPILARIYLIASKQRRRLVFLLAILLLFSLAGILHFESPRYILCILPYAHLFLTGMFLADYSADLNLSDIQAYILDAGAVCAFALMLTLDYRLGHALGVGATWLSCAFLTLAAFHSKGFRRVVQNAAIVAIGGMCYSIYLWHSVFISLVARGVVEHLPTSTPTITTNAVVTVSTVTLVIIASTTLYLMFERPFMNAKWPQEARVFLGSLIPKRANDP